MVREILRKILYSNRFTKQICLLRASLLEKFTIVCPILLKRIAQPDSVFLVFTPEHGNLGDHAIAKAETDLLVKNGIKYIEITGAKLEQLMKINCMWIMNGRKILINGGGILGTLWLNDEYLVRRIIQDNSKSAITCLPNTVYYENSEWGREELQKAIQIYNSHNNLTLYARESISFEFMKNFCKNVEIAPDMVFSLKKTNEVGGNRVGCLLCLRNDIERTLTEEQQLTIEKQARDIFGSCVRNIDMCVNYNISIDSRTKELEKKFEEFLSAKLIITDRLHGMIFSVITGTPCIVINSKSPKLRGCYEWIKDLEYIIFVDDITTIKDVYNSFLKEQYSYDNSGFLEWHNKLINKICDR